MNDNINAFSHYLLTQEVARAAKWRHEYAGVALELAMIGERLAEIESQHDPLNSLTAQKMSERDRLYTAAYYVVVGRMPEVSK